MSPCTPYRHMNVVVYPLHGGRVSGQLHASTGLPLGKQPPVSTEQDAERWWEIIIMNHKGRMSVWTGFIWLKWNYSAYTSCYERYTMLPNNTHIMLRRYTMLPNNTHIMLRRYTVLPNNTHIMLRRYTVLPNNTHIMLRRYTMLPNNTHTMLQRLQTAA
jgi:hypothetical protein